MFDITQLESADTSILHLKGPDEEPLVADGKPVTITLYGPGSDPFVAAEAKRTNRALTRSRRKIDLNADLVRADHVEFLASVTASIENLEYSPAEGSTGYEFAKALYSDRKLGWIVDQVTTHLGDYANFKKSSPLS
jgi:hypothetical protein